MTGFKSAGAMAVTRIYNAIAAQRASSKSDEQFANWLLCAVADSGLGPHHLRQIAQKLDRMVDAIERD